MSDLRRNRVAGSLLPDPPISSTAFGQILALATVVPLSPRLPALVTISLAGSARTLGGEGKAHAYDNGIYHSLSGDARLVRRLFVLLHEWAEQVGKKLLDRAKSVIARHRDRRNSWRQNLSVIFRSNVE